MSVSDKLKTRLIGVLISTSLPVLSWAAPQGGVVVGGTGSIQQQSNITSIQQNSQALAINWNSFNLKSNEIVNFLQPGSQSIALNRILDLNPSRINGQINANGKVVLVNPNGIFFSQSASVNVGGLIASGLDIDPNNFMNGDYLFNEVEGTEGIIINGGIINAALGGSVGLLGKQVDNQGYISANLGSVTLAAGNQAVLSFDQQGLLGIQVTQAVLQNELGIDPALVNSGEIYANGGRVLLTASASRDVFTQAVNLDGIERATSVVVHEDGSFTLGGGANTVNSGNIDVSATGSNNAGKVVLLGENIENTGSIRADSKHGQAGFIELHAQDKTELTNNSQISAQATQSGKGGQVITYADDTARIYAIPNTMGGKNVSHANAVLAS